MSRNSKIVFRHLAGLSICLGLATTHLMARNIAHDAWTYCLLATMAAGILALFIKYR